MLKFIKFKNALSLSILVLAFVSSCKDDDASSQVVLDSFGPSVLRGGELKFIGKNLNKVTSIILPDNVEVTASSFVTATPSLISFNVPDAAVEGFITLKTSDGDIVTKTALSILEPITITKIPTQPVKPGEVITIEGTYLNLIQKITFATSKAVTSFEAQSRTSLSVKVPLDAQTGILVLLDNEKIPNEIPTKTELQVTLPAITSFSPTTVKAGNNITITGTNLDLVTTIELGGGQTLKKADFVSATATQIVITSPASTADGKINLISPSQVKVPSNTSLTMAVPIITTVTPNPAKTGGEIKVTGTDLDLVSGVSFTGDKSGTIKTGGTATSITVVVPADAKSGSVKFSTKANKSVSSDAIAMVQPEITNVTASVRLNEDIIITGTNLDIVKTVKLTGGTTGTIKTSSTPTQLVVTIPPGTTTGKVTLAANNGDEVVSTSDLTILADVPLFTSFPATIKSGAKITLSGTKLNLTNEVIFPGNVKAVKFGDRTATTLEVYVPTNITLGTGKISFTTYGTDITQSTDINFIGLLPVKDAALVFFDFNGSGSKDSWWGSVSLTQDANSVDGTKYGRFNGTYNGWTDMFWRNSGNNFPGGTIGTGVDNYVLRFDINVQAPITGGNIKIRLQDDSAGGGDYWYAIGPAAPTGQGTGTVAATDGWITMTVPISAFKDNFGWGSNSPTNLSLIKVFGMAFDNGTSTVNIGLDNIRFEHK